VVVIESILSDVVVVVVVLLFVVVVVVNVVVVVVNSILSLSEREFSTEGSSEIDVVVGCENDSSSDKELLSKKNKKKIRRK
jgi:hypothetical protein